jgi:hypothetical protein
MHGRSSPVMQILAVQNVVGSDAGKRRGGNGECYTVAQVPKCKSKL